VVAKIGLFSVICLFKVICIIKGKFVVRHKTTETIKLGIVDKLVGCPSC